jgi:hypothetical protein
VEARGREPPRAILALTLCFDEEYIMNPIEGAEVPIACNLGALSPEERTRRSELAVRVREAAHGISELPTGFSVELGTDDGVLRDALELCLLERRCCPFLELALRLEPAEGPVSLRISGPSGVKEFLATNGILGCAGRSSDGRC